MITVIKTPKPNLRVRCDNCNSVLEFNKHDTLRPQGFAIVDPVITCPVCNWNVNVSDVLEHGTNPLQLLVKPKTYTTKA